MLLLDELVAAFATNSQFLTAFVGILVIGLIWLVTATLITCLSHKKSLLPVTILWYIAILAIPSSLWRLRRICTFTGFKEFLPGVAGLMVGIEILLWLTSLVAIVVFAKHWQQLRAPVTLLAILWVLVVVSSIPDRFVASAVLGVLVLIALGLSPLSFELFAKHLRWLLRTIMGVGLVMLMLWPNAATWEGSTGILGMNRFQGIISHANYMGAVAAIALVLELAPAIQWIAAWKASQNSKSLSPDKLRILCRSGISCLWIVVAGFELVASYSRASELSAITALIILSLVSSKTGNLRRPWLRWSIPLTLGLIGVFGWWVISQMTFEKIVEISSGRLLIWKNAVLPHLWEYPILGRGFDPMKNEDIIRSLDGFPANHAHNQLFESILESGALGLLSLLALIVGTIIFIIRSRTNRAIKLALASIIGVAAFMEVPLSFPLAGSSFAVLAIVVLIGKMDTSIKPEL